MKEEVKMKLGWCLGVMACWREEDKRRGGVAEFGFFGIRKK
ncbi:hypothetical protein L195_g061926 [Trifolium pratense]|uniref:Uncharacterized protein n=1 Tax=Trifolium pratense TaxID=57577 RepID=A0A2K3KCQ2_TRIPR|nr:hypothetical protein L195_g061926 [Trifolium pratense]